MKKMRKIFAVLLTLAMVLTMSITAFAASNPGKDKIFGTADDTATITVTGIDNETGIQVNAYRVVEAKYEGAGFTFRIISGNPRQFNYRDESAGLCVSAQKI